jgi:hypothetical protein
VFLKKFGAGAVLTIAVMDGMKLGVFAGEYDPGTYIANTKWTASKDIAVSVEVSYSGVTRPTLAQLINAAVAAAAPPNPNSQANGGSGSTTSANWTPGANTTATPSEYNHNPPTITYQPFQQATEIASIIVSYNDTTHKATVTKIKSGCEIYANYGTKK